MTLPILTSEQEQLRILGLENTRLRKELVEWRAAAGWRADGFGPQTPAEVAVFQRQAEYVNGQIAGLEIAKLRADVEFSNDCLEAAQKNGKVVCEQRDKVRAELEAQVTELKQKVKQAADLLGQREGAYEVLWENYQRDQTVRAACDSCFHECQGMVQYSTLESDQYWELAEALMELTSQRLGIAIQRTTDLADRTAGNQVVPDHVVRGDGEAMGRLP